MSELKETTGISTLPSVNQITETATDVAIFQNDMAEPKSGIAVFDLPCGYIDPKGELHTEIVVREMTGEEEDLLANPKIKISKKLNNVMGACVERIGTITDKGKIARIIPDLLQGDRSFLLFAIRRVSFGDIYRVNEPCPNCTKVGAYPIDLSTLNLVKMQDPMKRSFEKKLEDGTVIHYHLPTGADEQVISEMSTGNDEMTLFLLMRLDKINGKRVSFEMLKKLSSNKRGLIRLALIEQEVGVETTMNYDCSDCGHSFKRELNMDGSFFFPSLVPKK